MAMNEPTVCAILLTRDRPAMALSAVRAFRAQTYPNKFLMVWDSGDHGWLAPTWRGEPNERHVEDVHGFSIGELRNRANGWPGREDWPNTDILIHWDDDDHSHPHRITEQVALLQSSGADVVGYNEMLFWDERPGQFCSAWLYRGGILGTSLCYWRKTWERVPFRSQRLNPRHDPGVGEDQDFLQDVVAAGMKVVGCTSVQAPMPPNHDGHPRMIARIHGSNTSNAYDPAQMRAHPQHWKRQECWDEYCRERMAL